MAKQSTLSTFEMVQADIKWFFHVSSELLLAASPA